jgi:hypothetical protein
VTGALTYASSANADPDGDSNGTSITIAGPTSGSVHGTLIVIGIDLSDSGDGAPPQITIDTYDIGQGAFPDRFADGRERPGAFVRIVITLGDTHEVLVTVDRPNVADVDSHGENAASSADGRETAAAESGLDGFFAAFAGL